MKRNLIELTSLPLLLVLTLSSCGERRSTVYKKQRGKSAFTIESLDLQQGQLKGIFEFRSYRPKQLTHFSCKIRFLDEIDVNVEFAENISLGAFAKEVIPFQSESLKNSEFLQGKEKINYSANCEVGYDKGKEFLRKESVLFLKPGSDYQYR